MFLTKMAEISKVVMWDPNIHFSVKQAQATYKGGALDTFTRTVSTAFSNSNIVVIANVPNPNTVISKHAFIQFAIRFTFSGNTGNALVPLLQPGETGGLRAWPISSTMNNVQTQINNTTVVYQLNSNMPYLGWVGDSQQEEHKWVAETPIYQDRAQQYADMLGKPILPWSSSNPWQKKRGESSYNIISNTSTGAVVDFLLIEPLWFSPFVYGKEEVPGLIGVQTLNFQWNIADLTRAWSQAITDGAHTITGITADITTPTSFGDSNIPMMLFEYITLPLEIPAPLKTVHQLYNITNYSTNVGNVNSGQIFTATSNNIQFNIIPMQIHIVMRQRDQDRSITGTDTFAGLQNISVQWQNSNSILQSASTLQLYEIAKSNAVNMTLEEWLGVSRDINDTKTRGPGSFFSLRMGKDIPLLPTEYPGKKGTYQFQLTGTWTNFSDHAINYTLYIIVINDGLLEIYDLMATQTIGSVLGGEDINVASLPTVPAQEVKNFYGGTIFSAIPSMIRTVVSGVEKALPYVKKGIDFAHSIGFGGMMVGGCGDCGKCHKCKAELSGMGGRLMTRDELRQRGEPSNKRRRDNEDYMNE